MNVRKGTRAMRMAPGAMMWTNVCDLLAAKTRSVTTTKAASGVLVLRDSPETRSTLVKVCDDHIRLVTRLCI